jgi:soluble lytic murein transglycosylase-like protein
MKFIRLALSAAALAAVAGMYPAAAEENPVRQFLSEEFNAASERAEEGTVPAAQTASLGQPRQQQNENKTNENPWAGLSPSASAVPAKSLTPAPKRADDERHAPILVLVDKHAAALGLPAAFARAIVRVESNFNPKATGRQKEVGLMQIKYETARGIGFTGTREELYDPDTNLKWGMKYLARAWKLGGATPCGAVLRYQAGHMAKQETAASRAYCAKVNAHMASAN